MTSKQNNNKQRLSQSRKFIKKARELEADEAGTEFERAFAKIVPPKKSKVKKQEERNDNDSSG